VLVHEATFLGDEEERARETLHSTALDAATIAREADVGLLALTHISSRYAGGQVAREARSAFPETVVPKDFDTIDVPFAERGRPRLVKGGALEREPGTVTELEAVPRVEEASG
jgi:ribonuclease Z